MVPNPRAQRYLPAPRVREIESRKVERITAIYRFGQDPTLNPVTGDIQPIFDASDGDDGEERLVDIAGTLYMCRKIDGVWRRFQYA
jgi:hypothetical protein